MSAVFISHSSKDNDAAASLRVGLERAGYRSVFLDFHPEDGIPAGRNWEAELYANLRACQAVVVLCSEHSMSSKWCFAEITHAKALGKELFPIKVGPCLIDPILTSYQVLDLSAGPTNAYESLLRGFLSAKLDPASAIGVKPGRSPYPGLLAFEEDDAAVFFGRDDEVQEILDLLTRVRRFSGSRSVVLLGASGSGKSSVLKAGLLPRLRLKEDDWLLVEPFRPRARPFQQMAIALAASLKRYCKSPDWHLLRDRLEAAPEATLADTLVDLRVAACRDSATTLLLIDQAEELLSVQAEPVLGAIAAAPNDSGAPTIALFTLRSDFFAAFQRLAANVALQIQTLPIGPMPMERLPRIIEGPAERYAIPIEPDLTRQIVEDAAPHSLPLVAFALRELFEARPSPSAPMSLRDYRNRLGGLEGSIAKAAEAVFIANPLSGSALRDLRYAFLRMVRINEQGQYTRAPLPEREIPDSIRSVLERFVQARLLVAHADEGTEGAIEMTHEALLRSSDRLTTWATEDREFLRWRSRLAIAIAEWERAPDALLRGLSLSEACEFFSTRAGDLSEHECGFIDASRDAHEQEQLRWRRAYEAALSRQLAAQAEQLRSQPNMLERSVLLATEAMRHQQGPEADLTLRRGLTLLPEPVLRTVLDTNPRSVDLSPDGSMVVLGSVDGSVRLLRTATGDEAWLINHGGEVYTVAFSPDGQLVASGSETGHPTARISRAASGELVAALSAPASTLVLKFSPNGRYVAGAPGNQLASPPRPPDPFARIWEPVSGRLVTTIECAANPMALVFSEDSHWLAVRTEPGDVQVFAVDTGTLRTRMKKPDAVASVAFIGAGCIVFSHDGRLLAGSDASSGLSVWNADTGELVMSVGHSASVSSVDFSEDDAVLGIGGADGSVRVWQIREQRDIVQVRHASNVRGTRFLNRGRFATCGEDGAVSVWTARHEGYVRDNGREIVHVVHGSSVMGMAVNANHALLASASWDGTVRVSRLDAGLHERRFPDSREAEDITFSPDATVIATTGTARTALWGAASGAHLADVDNTLGYRVVFSRDQRYLGVVTSPVGIIWDYPVLRPRLRTDASSYANAIAFSPDSTRVAFGATDEVHLWDLASGSRILSVPVEREVLALAYSPDGTCNAVSTGYRFTFHRPDKTDPRVYLIDTAAGSRLAELPYRATVHDLVFSPDGRWLLTAGGDRSARLWLMNGLSQAASISHDTGVTGVAFSPDGRHFATACPDGVMVWETVTRKQMVRIVDPVGADTIGRTAVAFNPDGSLLATAMGSCGYTWRWKAEDLVAEACRKLSRDLTEEEWEHYFDDEPYRPTREVEKGSTAGRP